MASAIALNKRPLAHQPRHKHSCGSKLSRSYSLPQNLSLQRKLCNTQASTDSHASSSADDHGSGQSNRGLRLLEWAGKLVPQGPLVTSVKQSWRFAYTSFVTELAPQSPDGEYQRPFSAFPGWHIDSLDASRTYVAYVGPPCPWCHRVELALQMLGLYDSGESSPTVDVQMLVSDSEQASRGGWVIDGEADAVFGRRDLRGVYDAAVAATSEASGYTGRATAPVLLDKRSKSIVSNDSVRIVQLLEGLACQVHGQSAAVLTPEHMRTEIESLCSTIYDCVNNGVYKAGFATTQYAYDRAESEVFTTLEHLEQRLATSRFLHGERITLSDLWLLPTAARFDNVYHLLFRCARRPLQSYPNLQGWLRDMTSTVGMDTIRVDKWRDGYYKQLFPLNPSLIVPRGPSANELGLGVQCPERVQHLGIDETRDPFFRKGECDEMCNTRAAA